MSQYRIETPDGRRWLYGWDNPTQTFFAQRQNDEPDPCVSCASPGDDCEACEAEFPKEYDILIGFGGGFPRIVPFLTKCAEQGLRLGFEEANRLQFDKRTAESPTPLQQKMVGIMSAIKGLAEGA